MSRVAADEPLSNVAVEILLTLSSGPQHGYAVKLDIEDRTGGEVVPGSGSLYQAIGRLERRGLIAEDPEAPEAEDARRGRVYRIEPAGRAALRSELERMERVMRYARRHAMLKESAG
jgi:DNA-binding PadR family transcriptional regulator